MTTAHSGIAVAETPIMGDTLPNRESCADALPSQKLGYRFVKRAFGIAFNNTVIESNSVERRTSSEHLVEWKQECKVEDDPRITKLDGFPRRARLDETSQFSNVMSGR